VRRVDHSSRGILLNLMCLSVIAESQQRGGQGTQGLLSHKKKERKKERKLELCVLGCSRKTRRSVIKRLEYYTRRCMFV